MVPHPNSADFWLERILTLPMPGTVGIPHTVTVAYNHTDAMAAIEDGEPWPDGEALCEQVWEAVQMVGWDAFIRSDLSSAKHDGPDSYRAATRSDVERALSLTIQDNEMKFWMTGPQPRSFLVREWLDLEAPFTAFGGHPVAREWRYFASRAGVLCRHFYWPEHAIKSPSVENWRPLLAAMSDEEPPDFLEATACQAALVCAEGAPEWSVDFAQDRDGEWWLIDMATAPTSWHPEHEEAA